jgi:hypothetical protein
VAQHGSRFVERTPYPHNPVIHSMDRAGYPTEVRPHAIPSVTHRDVGAYVGGGRLLHNRIFARGPYAVTGPVADGTFATDYAGLKVRPGRVFLGASPDPSVGPTFAGGYRTDAHYPKDVFALRPFRKAIFEKSEKKHAGRE